MAEAEKKRMGKGALVVRVVLIGVLVAVVIIALQWRGVLGEHRRGLDLYTERKYEEAHAVFEAVLASRLSVIRIRSEARESLGRCKAEMATEIVFKERTLEGYSKALKLLDEAKKLAPSPEIDRRIAEYSEYKGKLENPAQPEPPVKLSAPAKGAP